jgi:hypothetical protein
MRTLKWEKAQGRGPETHTLIADSFDQLVRFGDDDSAEAEQQRKDFGARSSRKTDDDYEWTLGVQWEGARDYGLGRELWTEGAKDLASATRSASAIARDKAPAVRTVFAEAGFGVHAPRFAAGDPRHMMRQKKGAARSRPTVAIVLDLTCPHYVEAKDLMKITAAALALSAVLSRKGYRVRAYTAFFNVGRRPFFAAVAPLFSPEQPFSAARCAFQGMHPASMRRIGFAALERAGEPLSKHSGGYGTAMRGEKCERLGEVLRDQLKAQNLLTLPSQIKEDESPPWRQISSMDLGEVVRFVIDQARQQGLEI